MKRSPLRLDRAVFLALLLFCLCTAPLITRAQINQATIDRIVIDGQSHFSEEQIASASGLKIGQVADKPTLDAAANRLSETGAFSDVEYRYETANGKITLTFHILEAPNTLLCTFDNFVWFSPEEVDHAIRAEVPLYDGRVPTNGNLPQDVANALGHLLAQRHITATVTYKPLGKLGKPPTAYLYTAQGDLPTIKSVEYTGGPLDRTAFTVTTQRLLGHAYSATYAGELAKNDLDVIYQNQGYLRAQFKAAATFVAGVNANDPGNVSVVFTVTPGFQYAWVGADWNGNQNYSGADLDQLLGMKVGDLAAANKISAGVDAIHEAYGKKGYIAADLSPSQSFDDAAKHVRYSFKVEEGSQYHMGIFAVSGADNRVTDKIRKAWRLKAGDVFDMSYLKEFIEKDLSAAIAGSPLASPSTHFAYSMHPNPNTLTVDITISGN